jgi:hypothetical protein
VYPGYGRQLALPAVSSPLQRYSPPAYLLIPLSSLLLLLPLSNSLAARLQRSTTFSSPVPLPSVRGCRHSAFVGGWMLRLGVRD